MGINIFKLLLENFKGEKLLLKDCITKGASLSNVFNQTKTLTHLELNSIKFESSSQKKAIFEALKTQEQFKCLRIIDCNVDDSDFKYLQSLKWCSHFNNLYLDKISSSSHSNLL